LTIILGLCLVPASDISKIDFLKISFEDLVVHLMMFLGFSAILFNDLQRNTGLTNNLSKLSYTVFAFCILLGITTEVLQLLLTSLNRSGSITDFLSDLVGSGLGITGMRLIRQ
jgi:VanZ family protein